MALPYIQSTRTWGDFARRVGAGPAAVLCKIQGRRRLTQSCANAVGVRSYTSHLHANPRLVSRLNMKPGSVIPHFLQTPYWIITIEQVLDRVVTGVGQDLRSKDSVYREKWSSYRK